MKYIPLFSLVSLGDNSAMHFELMFSFLMFHCHKLNQNYLNQALSIFATASLIVQSDGKLTAFSQGESKLLRISNIGIPRLYISLHLLAFVPTPQKISGATYEKVVPKKKSIYFHIRNSGTFLSNIKYYNLL